MNSLAAQTRLIIRNDLRLLWRDFKTTRWSEYFSLGLAVLLFLIANAVSIAVFFAFHRQPELGYEMLAWVFFGFVMLGAAMNHAIIVLFERADFDLLLASPVSPRAILLARLLTMTVGAAVSVAIFVLPLLNGALLAVSWHYTAGYLVWLLLSCAVASAGVWSTLLLVKWLGPRRARTWAQVAAALLGAGIYLLSQLGQFLRRDDDFKLLARVADFLARPAWSFVGRAARGEPLALLILAAITVGFGAFTTRLLARLFISGVQEAGGISPSRKRFPHRRYVFVEGVMRATFCKDVRLIVRDPLLLARILPTALYLLPALFTFSRRGGIGLLAPLALILAAQFSYVLTTVSTAGEECWDLIRLSPTPELRLRIAKMAAGMALPLVVAVVLCGVLAARGRPGLAALTFVFSFATSAACAWLQVTKIKPTPRHDILKRGGYTGAWDVGHGILAGVIMLTGAAGLGFAGSAHPTTAASLLGINVVVMLFCFFTIKLQEIRPREFPSGSSVASGG